MLKPMTLAEATVRAWCRGEGHPEPVAEYEFHPNRKWRFDLAWTDPTLLLAVEFNGGVHTKGRHTRGTGYEEDRAKVNSASVLGWLVLECTYRQIEKGDLFSWLDAAFKLRGGAP